ncbi:MAG: long-chain acyl-CoA synthetase, partial [Acidimicrobiaceae bacterium]|nr:long-chain acyl-CoA synthetase [Acidimicrobiaceae bacterium]
RALVEEQVGDGGEGERLTYAGAADIVARQAAAIQRRIRPGDRVVIATPNSYRFLLLCLAASRAGGVPVPVNPKMRPAEVDHVIADSGAALVIRDEDEIGPGRPLAVAAPASVDDVAAILYTSGTTGEPKGARLTHRALVGQLPLSALWPSDLRRDEAVVGLPVAHIMGLVTLLSLAAAGVPTFLLPRFRAEAALDAIEWRRATMFIGVPAMYRMLLEAGAVDRDLRSVRLWASGADVMPSDLAHAFKRMGATVTLPLVGLSLGQAAFAGGYGMVELGGGVAGGFSPPMVPARLGDVLTPLPPNRLRVETEGGGQVRLGQVGELLVKGPGVLEGYHHDATATRAARTADGWFRTGDLVRRLPFGMVLFAGREKDVIMNGGYSVFAVEVERALEEHPAVAEAAVLGLPDARTGEVPVSAVRLRAGASTSEAALVAFGRERLADYKSPRRVLIVDQLPRTGTEKVQKSELRALFQS